MIGYDDVPTNLVRTDADIGSLDTEMGTDQADDDIDALVAVSLLDVRQITPITSSAASLQVCLST